MVLEFGYWAATRESRPRVTLSAAGHLRGASVAPLPAVGALVTAAHRSRRDVLGQRGDLRAALSGPPAAVPRLTTQHRQTGAPHARTRGEFGISALLCAGRC